MPRTFILADTYVKARYIAQEQLVEKFEYILDYSKVMGLNSGTILVDKRSLVDYRVQQVLDVLKFRAERESLNITFVYVEVNMSETKALFSAKDAREVTNTALEENIPEELYSILGNIEMLAKCGENLYTYKGWLDANVAKRLELLGYKIETFFDEKRFGQDLYWHYITW